MAQARWLLLILTAAACGPSAVSHGDGGGGDDGGGSNAVCTPGCTGNDVCSNGQCVNACQAAADTKSSIGCDYYSVTPDVIEELHGACFAAYITNTSNEAVAITVDRGGVSLPVQDFARVPTGQGQSLTYAPLPNGMLPPGQIAILFLARNGTLSESCPAGITPAVTATDAAVHGTGRGAAFHITTSAPTIAYDIFPYGGGDAAATSATLLLPTSVWDVNYVGVDAYARSQAGGADAAPYVVVVGKEAGTTVTVNPTAAIVGGTNVPGTPQGITATYTVGAGEILQFTQNAELAGSAITSDKPVGVWGGATCLNIPVATAACDSAHQQIPPVKAMGNHYAAVRYRNRYPGQEESVPWRFVGAVDGTTLTYSPSTPAGAPTTLAKGQVAEVSAPGPFVVSSQDIDHPFYMSAHMTGWGNVMTGFAPDRGDPEFVNIIPPEQYLANYTFFTDPTYPETNLVLTRMKTNGAFSDVMLDCGGTVTGWTQIDPADTMEYTRVDLVTGNFQSVNGCNNGFHTAKSTLPFGLVVWGWGTTASAPFTSTAVSYAYPAGASVKAINTVVIQ
ncbi:MAG TPA: IgGFc-binding protein [Kofleriaceae bacterium]|jgi:hypothetical protein